MRLQKTIVSSFMAATAFLFGACSPSLSAGASANTNLETQIYRGSVVKTLEDGSIEIEQQAGFNYGQSSIIFRIDDDTQIDLANGGPNQDAFVEVRYNGVLTRSLPPQGNAMEITVIANFTDGVVQNGTIQGVHETDDGYSIELLPLEAPDDSRENLVILHVPADGLENLSPEDLVPGAKVSAITRGIAAMSLPPQMPVVILTPYTTE